MCSARVLLHEMRVKVGVKESSKKKLVRSTWAGHLAEMGDVKLAERRCPESGNGGEEDRTCDGIKRDL